MYLGRDPSLELRLDVLLRGLRWLGCWDGDCPGGEGLNPMEEVELPRLVMEVELRLLNRRHMEANSLGSTANAIEIILFVFLHYSQGFVYCGSFG